MSVIRQFVSIVFLPLKIAQEHDLLLRPGKIVSTALILLRETSTRHGCHYGLSRHRF